MEPALYCGNFNCLFQTALDLVKKNVGWQETAVATESEKEDTAENAVQPDATAPDASSTQINISDSAGKTGSEAVGTDPSAVPSEDSKLVLDLNDRAASGQDKFLTAETEEQRHEHDTDAASKSELGADVAENSDDALQVQEAEADVAETINSQQKINEGKLVQVFSSN